MTGVVDALGKSLPVGPKFFRAIVKGDKHTVTVFLRKPPDMERVKREVTGANNTATVTCTCHQGQWDVTVTWVEPDTSKDKAIARALQEQENACGRGGAGHGAGANGHGIWTTEERAMYEQLEADYKFAMQLQADDKGRGGASRGGRAGRGHHGGAVHGGASRGGASRGGGGGAVRGGGGGDNNEDPAILALRRLSL